MKPIWSSLPIAAFVVVALSLSPLAGRAFADGVEVDRFVLEEVYLQVRRRLRWLEVMLHQAAHVVAVDATWNEALTQRGLRFLFILVACLQPSQ